METGIILSEKDIKVAKEHLQCTELFNENGRTIIIQIGNLIDRVNDKKKESKSLNNFKTGVLVGRAVLGISALAAAPVLTLTGGLVVFGLQAAGASFSYSRRDENKNNLDEIEEEFQRIKRNRKLELSDFINEASRRLIALGTNFEDMQRSVDFLETLMEENDGDSRTMMEKIEDFVKEHRGCFYFIYIITKILLGSSPLLGQLGDLELDSNLIQILKGLVRHSGFSHEYIIVINGCLDMCAETNSIPLKAITMMNNPYVHFTMEGLMLVLDAYYHFDDMKSYDRAVMKFNDFIKTIHNQIQLLQTDMNRLRVIISKNEIDL